jgi:16S rRNA (uracil1498-N3)-methyltransferase
MTLRYYAPEMPAGGGTVQLSDEEARHAARVMRASPGDQVVLFDGRGCESEAIIASIDKRNCVVLTKPATLIDREPDCEIHLGIAFPKPDRAKELIERLGELGVKRITPLLCDRTQRPPTPSLLIKLRRIVIESCKQSKRNVLMEIDPPVKFPAFVSQRSGGLCLIAHPDGKPIGQAVRDESQSEQASVLIGPEGGFTDVEVERAVASGFQKVGLGQRIYRIETAAAVIAALLSSPQS